MLIIFSGKNLGKNWKKKMERLFLEKKIPKDFLQDGGTAPARARSCSRQESEGPKADADLTTYLTYLPHLPKVQNCGKLL